MLGLGDVRTHLSNAADATSARIQGTEEVLDALAESKLSKLSQTSCFKGTFGEENAAIACKIGVVVDGTARVVDKTQKVYSVLGPAVTTFAGFAQKAGSTIAAGGAAAASAFSSVATSSAAAAPASVASVAGNGAATAAGLQTISSLVAAAPTAVAPAAGMAVASVGGANAVIAGGATAAGAVPGAAPALTSIPAATVAAASSVVAPATSVATAVGTVATGGATGVATGGAAATTASTVMATGAASSAAAPVMSAAAMTTAAGAIAVVGGIVVIGGIGHAIYNLENPFPSCDAVLEVMDENELQDAEALMVTAEGVVTAEGARFKVYPYRNMSDAKEAFSVASMRFTTRFLYQRDGRDAIQVEQGGPSWKAHEIQQLMQDFEFPHRVADSSADSEPVHDLIKKDVESVDQHSVQKST